MERTRLLQAVAEQFLVNSAKELEREYELAKSCSVARMILSCIISQHHLRLVLQVLNMLTHSQ